MSHPRRASRMMKRTIQAWAAVSKNTVLSYSLCACTVDNPLAKARGLSLRTGAQTMLYLSLVYCCCLSVSKCCMEISEL